MNAPEAVALLQPQTLTSSWNRPSAREWARVLAAFPLFSGVSKRRLRKLVRNATFAELAAGDTIRSNGEGADSLYVILGGAAKAVQPSGARALGIGDYFGEPAVEGRPSPATTVVATQELHVVNCRTDSSRGTCCR